LRREPTVAFELDHHSALTGEDVEKALLGALDAWERAGCDCCSPNPLEHALDGLRDPAVADRLRKFGIELAIAGQWLIDDDDDA
jgi:hypothetical protein